MYTHNPPSHYEAKQYTATTNTHSPGSPHAAHTPANPQPLEVARLQILYKSQIRRVEELQHKLQHQHGEHAGQMVSRGMSNMHHCLHMHSARARVCVRVCVCACVCGHRQTGTETDGERIIVIERHVTTAGRMHPYHRCIPARPCETVPTTTNHRPASQASCSARSTRRHRRWTTCGRPRASCRRHRYAPITRPRASCRRHRWAPVSLFLK